MMKIDLHVHCSERSACAISSERQQIEAAIDAGLDAIVFTDHRRLTPQERLAALNEEYAPFRIFGGIEVNVDREDLLVFGIHDPYLERIGSYSELHAFVRERGGYLALAHPFRYSRSIHIDLEKRPPDALEAASNNIAILDQVRIRRVARDFSLPVLCNSDSHSERMTGQHYNVLPQVPEDEADLIRLLKAGEFRCVA